MWLQAASSYPQTGQEVVSTDKVNALHFTLGLVAVLYVWHQR